MKDLRRFEDMELDEFTSDPIYEAAAVRMLQVAVEAVLDICSHLSAREGWGLPSTYTEAVGLAADDGMIPRELEHTFKAMARFRNQVVHLYEEKSSTSSVTIVRIFGRSSSELPDDISEIADRAYTHPTVVAGQI